MSDQTSIFNGSQSSDTPANQNNSGGSNSTNSQSSDAVAHLLGSIKNEKGEQKYKTLEDAMKALQHSQNYIPELTSKLSQQEQELKDARAEASRIAELERSVLALTQPNNGNAATTANSSVSEEAIAEIVTRTLTRAQQADIQKKNVSDVVSAMQSKFGAEAEKVFYTKAQELGMTVQEFNAMAARTPKAVLELIGVKPTAQPSQGQPGSSTQSSVNSGAFAPAQQSFIGRNKTPTLIGATSKDLMNESQAAKKMVEELHAQGKSVHDLSDPKVYMTYFQ